MDRSVWEGKDIAEGEDHVEQRTIFPQGNHILPYFTTIIFFYTAVI